MTLFETIDQIARQELGVSTRDLHRYHRVYARDLRASLLRAWREGGDQRQRELLRLPASRTRPKTPNHEKGSVAGLRQRHRAQSTGTEVSVYDGPKAGLDSSAGRWQTVCEDHSTICSHETFKTARHHAAKPEGWCEDCQKMLDGRATG